MIRRISIAMFVTGVLLVGWFVSFGVAVFNSCDRQEMSSITVFTGALRYHFSKLHASSGGVSWLLRVGALRKSAVSRTFKPSSSRIRKVVLKVADGRKVA